MRPMLDVEDGRWVRREDRLPVAPSGPETPPDHVLTVRRTLEACGGLGYLIHCLISARMPALALRAHGAPSGHGLGIIFARLGAPSW